MTPSPVILLLLHVLLLLVSFASAGPGDKEKMEKKLHKHFWDQMCWGADNQKAQHQAEKASLEACMGKASPAPRAMPQPVLEALMASYQLPSHPLLPQYSLHALGKRSTTDQQTAEFINDWYDFNSVMEAKVGNLTCVFKKMGMLTPAGDVNLGLYQTGFWAHINLASTLAGSDPAWRKMLVTRWTDCYKRAVAVPTESLTRHPLMKDVQLARNMHFWRCSLAAKTDCCSAALQHKMLEDMYGEDDDSVNWQKYGLPGDKYELASVASMVLSSSASPMEVFMESMFRSDGSDF